MFCAVFKILNMYQIHKTYSNAFKIIVNLYFFSRRNYSNIKLHKNKKVIGLQQNNLNLIVLMTAVVLYT